MLGVETPHFRAFHSSPPRLHPLPNVRFTHPSPPEGRFRRTTPARFRDQCLATCPDILEIAT